MPMSEKKKMVAAVTAVLGYLEQEAALVQAGPVRPEAPAVRPPRQPGMWTGAGRQSMMQMRHMMQFKAFQRPR